MIPAAVVPPPAISVAEIRTVTIASVRKSLEGVHGAIYGVTKCRRTVPHHGTCSFWVTMPAASASSKGLQRCTGRVEVRDIGKGYERRFIVYGCKPV